LTVWHHGLVKKPLLIPFVSILQPGTFTLADFNKGSDAYQSGDYATAMKEWTLAADEGKRLLR
jgi:hypothetical protein